MFKITLVASTGTVELETENRSLARSVTLLAKENKIEVEVAEEREPRVVKFKGVD